MIKENRKNGMNHTERTLYNAMVNSGLDPEYEYPIDKLKADFAFPNHYISVEVDGPTHRTPEGIERDKKRDYVLHGKGWIVLRFPDNEVRGDLKNIVKKIKRELKKFTNIANETDYSKEYAEILDYFTRLNNHNIKFDKIVKEVFIKKIEKLPKDEQRRLTIIFPNLLEIKKESIPKTKKKKPQKLNKDDVAVMQVAKDIKHKNKKNPSKPEITSDEDYIEIKTKKKPHNVKMPKKKITEPKRQWKYFWLGIFVIFLIICSIFVINAISTHKEDSLKCCKIICTSLTYLPSESYFENDDGTCSCCDENGDCINSDPYC